MIDSRIAILASGSGTNAERIINHFRNHPSIEVVMVLANNPEAHVLTRAVAAGVPARAFNQKQFRETGEVLDWLLAERVTHLVLAGFLWLIPHHLIEAFPDRIINIHPALLPKHGGKGMYGAKVHESVKQAGDKETGITIHLINEKYDEGRIVFQQSCPVEVRDTPDDIARKVHELEYKHFPDVIERWILGTGVSREPGLRKNQKAKHK